MSKPNDKSLKLNLKLKNKSHASLLELSKEIKKQLDDGTLTGDQIAYKTAEMTPTELTTFYNYLGEQGLGNLSEVAGDVDSLEREFRQMHAAQESWKRLG